MNIIESKVVIVGETEKNIRTGQIDEAIIGKGVRGLSSKTTSKEISNVLNNFGTSSCRMRFFAINLFDINNF